MPARHAVTLGLSIGAAITLAACRVDPDAAEGRRAGRFAMPSHATTAATDSSAVAFVREFYATYAPRLIPNGLQAVDSIIAERPGLFAPALLAALRRDAALRDTATEIVGLDFDPFLNTQDAC